jgi:hypothetical protein
VAASTAAGAGKVMRKDAALQVFIQTSLDRAANEYFAGGCRDLAG